MQLDHIIVTNPAQQMNEQPSWNLESTMQLQEEMLRASKAGNAALGAVLSHSRLLEIVTAATALMRTLPTLLEVGLSRDTSLGITE